jgi:hypothetical protein
MAGNTISHGNFDLVQRFNIDNTDVNVSKWRSRETGLSIVHLDYEGIRYSCTRLGDLLTIPSSAPLVNGYFVVATESAYLLTCTCLTQPITYLRSF